LRYIEVVGIFIAAVGAVIFGTKQYQINKRMKELADYVAVSIYPSMQGQLHITNVGRSNLYLHKWEVGPLNETFVRPWLLPIEKKSEIIITIPPLIGQHFAKFYLTDEKGQRYISTGEVAVESIISQSPVSTAPVQTQDGGVQGGTQSINIQVKMRAWSYKTEKCNWMI